VEPTSACRTSSRLRTDSDVLNQFADAGQTARAGSIRYQKANAPEELSAALREILGSVAISCDVALDAAPPTKGLVNVYFDERVIAYGEMDGWAWTSDSSLQIRGERCSELKSGAVVQLQVVAGCETVIE
jgi:hypothetical protein